MRRRDFVALGSAMAATIPGSLSSKDSGISRQKVNKAVDFLHDGVQLAAEEYAYLLLQLAENGKIKPDYYSNGGVVEEMENKFAKLLGHESAMFLPTGTLANHMSARRLAGNSRKVIVQDQSHFFNDSGDCAQTLSGLHLIPLGAGGVEFELADVEKVISSAKTARVETKVGAMSIETPVRRLGDRMFSYDKIKSLTSLAKTLGIKTHLDGARIFIQAVHTDKTPAEYGSMFDTAYTSLWKCFNAPSGAVLAGSKAFTENLFHERRMFGGSLPAAWAFAAVALYYADGFIDEYKSAWKKATSLLEILKKEERFKPVFFDRGSHIVRLNMTNTNLERFRENLSKKNIQLAEPWEQGFSLRINPTLNRMSVEELSGSFLEALKSAG